MRQKKRNNWRWGRKPMRRAKGVTVEERENEI